MSIMPIENSSEISHGVDRNVKAGLPAALGRWYAKNMRDLPWRRTRDPYAIWISEVMLQQTQVKTVIPYYQRFLKRFPRIEDLAAADIEEVYKLWEGLGYYSRARHLHQAAGIMTAETGGRLPADLKALRRLPGIGPYIAAAVSSIAFGRPVAVVDGNIKRVLTRLFLLEAPVNQASSYRVFQGIADILLDEKNPGRHNQALMELGALTCIPQPPRCDSCPLDLFCAAFRENDTARYPRRTKRPALPVRHWAAGVIIRNDRVLVVRRPEQGLLGGLWEFPCIPLGRKDDLLQGLVAGLRETVGIQVDSPRRLTSIGHAYTHFRLVMDVFLCSYKSGRVRLNGPAGFKWLPPDRLTTLPLHKAVHKALPALQDIRLDEPGVLQLKFND